MISKISTALSTTFSSLKYKNFRYFWIGQCVSLTGTWMQRTAQVWLVYTLTKSPLLVGILGVCQFLPMMLFTLFAGVFVDRFPKKKILLLTQALFMLQAFALTALTYFHIVQYWHVLILSAIFGLTQTLDMPARQSFFIEMVGRKDLMNAISLNSTIVNLAKIVGPAISGIVIVKFGPVFCFFLNGISYIAVLWGIFLIHTPDRVVRREHRNVMQEIKEGIQYIKKDKALMNNVIIMAVVCTFAMNNDVVIPVFAKTALQKGAYAYTTLMSAAGVGSLCGALIMAAISKKGVKEGLLIFDGISTAILQMIIAFSRQYWLCIILVAGVGFMNLTFINTANSIFQLKSTDEYRGRVMGVYSFLNQGSTPIGNFYAGTVMEQWGGGMGYLACGLTTFLLIIPVIAKKKTR
ncbi:MAG TPA: MFS transporter [Firmicutes bacterium]|nr:MFS transporter [Bacillota bacterium]